jgi:O-antigen chain-terminating methyltransferase
MQDNFYKAFEDKYRGSRELIKERLKVYLPFLEIFKDVYKKEELKILDLGCGRGEWLELVIEKGFNATGVDLDEGMLEACKVRNLNVIKKDALEFLKSVSDESYIAVSGFHIVEHLPFNVLKDLVKESLRVLKAGGLLVLETPNPENISVATINFWLDPTHIRPIPPMLLEFLTNYSGFYRSKILRLQEPKEIIANNEVSIKDIFYNVSPDYSIVAQKEDKKEILALFDKVFSKNYGIDLNHISDLYEAQHKFILMEIEEQNLAWQNIISNLSSELNALRMEYTSELNALRMEYTAVINSESWKITRPLRLAGKFARWFKTGIVAWLTFAPQSRPRRVIKKILIKLKEELTKRPKFKCIINMCLKPFPKLENRLRRIGKESPVATADCSDNHLYLSPRAKQIYNDLKKAIEQVKNENPN